MALKKSKIASPIACNMWDRISPKLTLANADVKGVVMKMSKPINDVDGYLIMTVYPC